MQFGLSGGYRLDFPSNFPKKMPTLRTPNGQSYVITRTSHDGDDDDVCAAVVGTVAEFLRNLPPSRRGPRGRGNKNY